MPGAGEPNIIRNAPPALRMVLGAVFKLTFQAPDEAAPPILYLAAAPEVEGCTGVYMHIKTEKLMDEKCYDEAANAALWDKSVKVLNKIGRPLK